MNQLTPLRVPQVVFGLTFFWGVVLWSFTVGLGTYNPGFLLTWTCSIAIGVWLAEVKSNQFHLDILTDLKYDFAAARPLSDFKAFYNVERGVYSHLGPVPFHRQALKKLDADADELLNLAQEHCPTEFDVNGLAFLRKYLDDNRIKHPGHARLMEALLATYLHPEQIKFPAGFAGRHGNRNLLRHSLLVSGLCVNQVGEFTYELPLGLSPQNHAFKLDPQDPLLALVGLAHDMGKFECLQFDSNGNAYAIAPGHDSAGASLLALMDEYWDPDIDAEDRRIMQTVLAFYHHPSEVPVERIKGEKEIIRVTSDRLHAVLELLIHCDIMAGRIEWGQTYKEAAKATKDTITSAESGDPRALINGFFNHLAVKAGINTRGSGMRSVAFKLTDAEHTKGRTYLYFDEATWREEFMRHMGIDDDGVKTPQNQLHPITNIILKELNQHGYLVDLGRQAHTVGKADSLYHLIYSVDFQDPVSKQVAVQFKTCFVLDITDIEKLKDMTTRPNCHSMPVQIKQRFGARGRTRSAADSLVEAQLTGKKPEAIGVDVCAVANEPSNKLMASTKAELKLYFFNQDDGSIEPELKNKIQIVGLFALESGSGKAWAIKGLEPYLEDRGFDVPTLASKPKLVNKLGFLMAKPSVQTPGTYVWLTPESSVRKKQLPSTAPNTEG